MSHRFAASLLAWAALSGCAHSPVRPLTGLERAAQEATGPSPSARTLALAGYQAWLADNQPGVARARFERALQMDATEPYARYGLVLLAQRRGAPQDTLNEAVALTERAPRHPLAAAAAQVVLELAGTAAGTDEVALAGATRALNQGASGEAALLLRLARARILGQRGDANGEAAALTEAGVATSFTLVGPLFAHRFLSFDSASQPELDGALPEQVRGELGEMPRRTVPAPGGAASLAGESGAGDGYLLAVDVQATEPAEYLLRVTSAASHRLYLDGAQVWERRGFARPASNVTAARVQLAPGRHRLLLRLIRDERQAGVLLAVARADGRPSTARLSPAQGAAPAWSSAQAPRMAPVRTDARRLTDATEAEAGPALARLLGATDGLGQDADGVRQLLGELGEVFAGAHFHYLHARALLEDAALPRQVARGRVSRELDAALEKDGTHVQAMLLAAALALDDARYAQAAELLKRARAAFAPAHAPIALLQARVDLALGVDAAADAAAREALEAYPGLCQALELRYDLARRRDAVALADSLLGALKTCPDSLSREAEHAKLRGDWETATAAARAWTERDPGSQAALNSWVGLLTAQGKLDDAVAALEAQRSRWPRNPYLLRRLAEVHAFAGRDAQALALREAALALDGGNLALRRLVARAKTGKEPLAEHAIDPKAAIEAYERTRGDEEAASAYVLDSAVVEVFPDGSQLERVHVIQKVLAQSGLAEAAEVSVPRGAYVLALRTLKSDGRALEPEDIDGKDAVSLPNVQVGDYVESEYLQALSARGPSQPGFTASAFYFQLARQPNHWTRYKVIAPRELGMGVDPHGVDAQPPTREGSRDVFSHEERQVPPFVPEPHAPPSTNEALPFVVVGAGTQGNEGVVAAYADAFFDRAQVTHEVEAFARAAAAGKEGVEAVRAVHAAVSRKLQGRDGGLALSAAASLAQDRGSRLWLTKAALEALGVPTRVVAVRTFAADPAPYRYPNESLLPYLCLMAMPPSGEPVWLDTSVRYGPFGTLPEPAMGEREAYTLPEPGRPLERMKTPKAPPPSTKYAELHLALSTEGALRGEATERYEGHEAARLAEALDALAPEQRHQAIQAAIARYFGGAELTGLELKTTKEVGAPLEVRYRFESPRFARVEERRLLVPPITLPAFLGRRYLQMGARKTPLYIPDTERTQTSSELTVPPGFTVTGLLPDLERTSRFGAYARKERWEKNRLRVDETFRLGMARVPVSEYEAFARFAGEVDLLQARELTVEQR